MKNFTIKKVALGLFLAGYAASSAFALDATTNKVINGNAPILKAVNGTRADHTLTVVVSQNEDGSTPIGNRVAKVGDYVVIKFNLEDADGDNDTGKIKDTLKVFAKKTNGWEAMSVQATEDHSDAIARISFKITSDFLGAEKIGFKLLERTDFGIPYTNNWLEVNDIWATGTPNTAPVDPNNPENPPSNLTDSGNPISDDDQVNNPHGPGGDNTGIGNGPIITDDAEVGIFLVDGGVTKKDVNYKLSSAPAPKYGQTFQAIVWTDSDLTNGVMDSGAVELTGYTFTWTLDGSYNSKPATSDTIATGDTITLATTNSDTMYTHGSYDAGGQGYHLKVTTN
ncbi:MAG: hypothetical protein J6567_01650 [Gilliamella sp.]|uniref:hypothetical protein n=1 Tax=Gilliamella sp. TaxID=1891236 RepID=UPI0025E3AC36|nr:hypothetical protein [Gilliamella sp.]MCO6536648.1 hypothetical protein [Gilliamella sp.]MCO6549489.1 hypothetical protein [Gilliamella sp.]